MTNYQSFLRRIKETSEPDKLRTSLDRLYNAGIFTVSEFIRLDALILQRQSQL